MGELTALAKPEVIERWTADAAGVRPAAVAQGDNVITMFDVIGEDYWTGGGITAKKIAAQLRAIGDRPVEVQINSFGGDMFAGLAIYELLRAHPQEITVKIMGMAASAASLIAMAGDRVEIGAASFLMIHNCWIVVVGNRHDLTANAALLAKFDEAMAGLYAETTGAEQQQIAQWMDEETFMTGQEAVDRGFADGLLPADQVVTDAAAATSERKVNDLRAMELTLVAAGLSRGEARARINKIKGDGTPGAAGTHDAPTPGAGDKALAGALAGLLTTIQSNRS